MVCSAPHETTAVTSAAPDLSAVGNEATMHRSSSQLTRSYIGKGAQRDSCRTLAQPGCISVSVQLSNEALQLLGEVVLRV
jgi:hypothetical protein